MDSSTPTPSTSRRSLFHFFFFFLILPILASLLLYPLILSTPARLSTPPPTVNHSILRSSDLVGSGLLSGPEDFAYDKVNSWIYTGCADGWIKRVKVNTPNVATEAVVENLVNTGGRPLGLVLSHGGGGDGTPEVIIADADKGLLKLTNNEELILLTNEAEGNKFKLTDGVDVASDGTIYFTDSSLKHPFKDLMLDILGIESNGRLLSFNPTTGETKVLLRNLYFANGVTVSPDQNSVIFCETTLRRCSRYYMKTGSVEVFIENIPGSPDNIHYDGEGRYWIALYSSLPSWVYKLMEYELFGKGLMIFDKYIGMQMILKNSGVLAVDLEGKPIAHFSDKGLSGITSGVKIGKHMYCGSLHHPHIVRLDMTQHPV